MLRVLTICDENGVSEFYRTLTPYRLLADAGEIDLEHDNGHNPALIDHLRKYDVIVFSRPDSPEHTLILAEARRLGVRTVVDIDDNLILLPPSIAAYGAWHVYGQGKITPRLWYFKHNIKQADVLTVSTPELGRQLCDGEPHRMRSEGDYIVLPNCVLGGEWARAAGGPPAIVGQAVKEAGHVWVGWWGIYNHWDDWRDVAPIIEPVIERREYTRLVVLGMPEVVHLFPRLRKTGQLIVGPFVAPADLGEYRRLVAQFDVALAPTSQCPFNESKSDLKMLQYGAAGCPVIASATTYGEWREFATILGRPGDWGDALASTLDNLAEARRQGAALKERVLATRTYEGNYRQWLTPLLSTSTNSLSRAEKSLFLPPTAGNGACASPPPTRLPAATLLTG